MSNINSPTVTVGNIQPSDSNIKSSSNFGPKGSVRWMVMWKIAQREMRQVISQFRLFFLLLTCGVFAVAVVGTFSASLSSGLKKDGKNLLGGDIAFSIPVSPASKEEFNFLNNRYDKVTTSVTMTSMARLNEETFRLVNMKAVDDVFPIVKQQIIPSGDYNYSLLEKNASGQWGILVAKELFLAMNLKIGDTLKIGNGEFEIRGELNEVPEIPLGRPALAPRVIASVDGVIEAGIILPGSIYRYEYRVLAPTNLDIANEEDLVKDLMPDSSWRITVAGDGSGRVGYFIDTGNKFFTLVGLISLLVAGVGMASGVNTYVDTKRRTIAILKSLGADSSLIIGSYLIVISIVSLLGVLLGLLLAVLVPNLAALFVSEDSLLRLDSGVYLEPLLFGAIYGFGVSIAGSLWPLSKVPGFYPQALFRDLVNPTGFASRLKLLYVSGGIILGLVLLTFVFFGVNELTFILLVSMVICPLVLLFCAWMLRKFFSALPQPKNAVLRLAIHSFCRPGAYIYSIFLSLGLGLTLLTTMALVDARLRDEFSGNLSTNIPSFFVLGIQKKEIEDFKKFAKQYTGESGLTTAPNLRGRILSVNGMSPKELEEKGIDSWALRGDRGITWSTTLPINSKIKQGKWWDEDYKGEPLVSLSADVVADLRMKIGDTITYSVLGRPIKAKLASSRDVVWNSFAMNFATVFDGNSLKNAPGGFISTVTMPDEQNDKFVQEQQKLFPSSTPIKVKTALEVVQGIIERLLIAVSAAGVFALIVGNIVLIGAIAADHRRRVFEVTVFSVCGVSPFRIVKTYITEYLMLAFVLVAAVMALSSMVVYTALTQVFNLDFSINPFVHLAIPVIGIIFVVASGVIATLIALREKPSQRLRAVDEMI